MSSGEYKKSGMGLQIAYGVQETPFGRALLATTKQGICNLHFLDLDSQLDPQQIIRESWSNAQISTNAKLFVHCVFL